MLLPVSLICIRGQTYYANVALQATFFQYECDNLVPFLQQGDRQTLPERGGV
jgi:hypothetical protein